MSDLAHSPGPEELRYLRAAFGEPAVAAAAWQDLRASLDIDGAAHETHGVYAQFGQFLRATDPDHPVRSRIDGVRKRAWYANTRRVAEIAAAQEALRAAGIGAVATGGLAVLLHQDDLGARPLVVADLAVAEANAPAAQEALTATGWRLDAERRDGWLLDLRAATFSRNGQSLSLRWVEFADAPGTWPYGEGAVELAVNERAISVAGAADLLAYTLIEGYQLWGYTPTRRYADALLLLREPIDWNRFVAIVRARHAVGSVVLALKVLRQELFAPVPGEVLRELQTGPQPSRQRLAERAARRSGTLAAWLRRSDDRSSAHVVAGFPGYLRELWGAGGWVDLPKIGYRKVRARSATHSRDE